MIFGAAYYPEHRDPGRWEHDLDMMAAAGIDAVRVGEFAWKRFEPSDGRYDFGWLDDFMKKAERRGIRILLCPPIRTAPAWLVERDRSILIVNDQGIRLEFGSRYTFCINHPLLREKGLALAAQMARRYGNSKAIVGWHLDNEYGDEPDCFCPVCMGKWHAWLKRRYNSIDDMNRRWGNVFWGLEYDRFDQTPMPMLTKSFHSPAHLLNWRRFRSDCTVEMVGLHADTLRDNGARQFVTTNNQSQWNPRTDYFEMARSLDVCGTNYYPPYGPGYRDMSFGLANVRGYKGLPFQVHELRNGPHGIPGEMNSTPMPGEVERLCVHAIANGADALYFFRWRACPFGCEQTHGTLTDYDGQPTRVYDECRKVGANLRRIARILDGSRVISKVGVLFDFETRWIMEAPIRWNGPRDLYMTQCRLIYNELRTCGVNCDSVGRQADFSQYRLLAVPFLSAVDDEIVEKLRRYVEAGGTLLCHPLTCTKDKEGTFFPSGLHEGMSRLLGIARRDFATSGGRDTHLMEWSGVKQKCGMFMDWPEPADASVEARYVDTWFGGKAAMTARRCGKGNAIYLACLPAREFYACFFRSLLKDIGVEPILACEIPTCVEVCERTTPDGKGIVFLMNGSDETQTLALPRQMTDIWHGESVGGVTAVAPNGVRILMD